jgi:hypothetical protein
MMGIMDLAGFIQTRRAEIADEIRVLQKELARLDAAERAAARVDVGWQTASSEETVAVQARPKRGPSVRVGTIKDWIVKALASQPGGLQTEEVIIAIELIGGPTVPRNSMTPQLSRLKKNGVITYSGKHWMVVQPQAGLPPAEQVEELFA